MNNYMAVIEYDGTKFNGFQIQPEGTRTVQQELISVLSMVLNRDTDICYAGRTDAGVHAKGQVIGFKSDKELDLYRFRWSINGLLPDDIAVKEIKRASISFDSRRDAKLREYTYYVVNADYHSVFLKKYSILITQKLDLKTMRRVAGVFAGEHDFAPFASPGVKKEYTRRKIYDFTIDRESPGMLVFKIKANSFLYNMVRIIVGTILEVGKGEREIKDIKQAAMSGEGNFVSSMAPAKGLFLTRVEY
ncbi:MAG TPA: tRNA pseudouridine(38-40) synthase TruA [Actinobacteria bacterium]|nr:tRNA pseudouridine(38-40) synthase TruA [Actinomycetota bacterium]